MMMCGLSDFFRASHTLPHTLRGHGIDARFQPARVPILAKKKVCHGLYPHAGAYLMVGGGVLVLV